MHQSDTMITMHQSVAMITPVSQSFLQVTYRDFPSE
tara:strand:- start:2100 stop:2207 length:108 start_codon:yes stop_codon:yes gene_type:complete